MEKVKKFIFTLVCVYLSVPLFANEISVPELQTVGNTIKGFFTSGLSMLIATIALGIIGFMWWSNQGSEQAKKQLKNWAIGVGIVLGAPSIAGLFFTSGVIIL